MIYSEDFTIDSNYQDTFVAMVMCDSIQVAGNTITYIVSQGIPKYSPYFLWVCYPQVD